MLTVACVFMRGPYPYTIDYVIRLERMVRKHLDRPFRFVCLTDRAKDIVPWGIEAIPIPNLKGIVPDNGVGYWSKVWLFHPDMGWNGRVLFLDLDTLVVNALDPIVDYPASLALASDVLTHSNSDRFGRRVVRRFNSSVMVWDGGLHTDLFTRWTPDVAQKLSTDQDWIGEQSEEAKAMPLEWFPRISQAQPPWADDAKVVLVKKPKNAEASKKWPWFDEMWGGWAA